MVLILRITHTTGSCHPSRDDGVIPNPRTRRLFPPTHFRPFSNGLFTISRQRLADRCGLKLEQEGQHVRPSRANLDEASRNGILHHRQPGYSGRTCRNDRVTRGMDFFPAIGKYKGGAGPRHEQGALSHSLTAEFSGLRLHCRCCEHENENNRKTAQKDFL